MPLVTEFSTNFKSKKKAKQYHFGICLVLEAVNERFNVMQHGGIVPPPENVCRGERVTAAFHNHRVDVCCGYVVVGPAHPQDLRLARVNIPF